ncbi:hypothetical protein Hanom_Chr11g01050611 [Helianthus anomalus]
MGPQASPFSVPQANLVVLAISDIKSPKRKDVVDLHVRKVESSYNIEWYYDRHAKMMVAVSSEDLEELGFVMSSSMKMEVILQRFVPEIYYVKAAMIEAGA